jgi:hypothetical protein
MQPSPLRKCVLHWNVLCFDAPQGLLSRHGHLPLTLRCVIIVALANVLESCNAYTLHYLNPTYIKPSFPISKWP